MTELRPCPFCGGEAQADNDAYRERYINEVFGYVTEPAARNAWVFCTVCGAKGRTIHDREYDGYKSREREERMRQEAAEAWNHRAEEERV